MPAVPIVKVAGLARRTAAANPVEVDPMRNWLQFMALAIKAGSAFMTLNMRLFTLRSTESEVIVGCAPNEEN